MLNKDDVIRLAREAGFVEYELDNGTTDSFDKRYATFAKLVAEQSASSERERIKQANKPELEKCNAYIKELEKAVIDEREACAEIGDAFHDETANCGDLIRARGQAT